MQLNVWRVFPEPKILRAIDQSPPPPHPPSQTKKEKKNPSLRLKNSYKIIHNFQKHFTCLYVCPAFTGTVVRTIYER